MKLSDTIFNQLLHIEELFTKCIDKKVEVEELNIEYGPEGDRSRMFATLKLVWGESSNDEAYIYCDVESLFNDKFLEGYFCSFFYN